MWVCVHVRNFKAEDFTGVGRCPQRLLEGVEYYRLLFAGHIETGALIIPSSSIKKQRRSYSHKESDRYQRNVYKVVGIPIIIGKTSVKFTSKPMTYKTTAPRLVWDLLRGGGREDPTVCGVEEGFSKLFGGSRSK